MAASSSSESTAAMQEAFFGASPTVVLDDLYRLREDYIADGIDAFESRAKKLMEESVARKARLRKSRQGSVTWSTDIAGGEEVARGADNILGVLMEALELAGDMFDVFALRNAFRWPGGLKYEVPGSSGSGRLYTASEEAVTDNRISSLEAAVLTEKKKRRILAQLRTHLSKRVPQAEEAAAILDEAARQLEAASAALMADTQGAATGGAESLAGLTAYMGQVAGLRALLARLAQSSPAAAAAIRRVPGSASGDMEVEGADSAGRDVGAPDEQPG